MTSWPGRNDFELRLRRSGLPRDYVVRTADELEAHYANIASHAAAQERSLGNMDELARQFVREYRRHTMIGRWPLLTMLAAFHLPVVLSLGYVVGVSDAYELCAKSLGQSPEPSFEQLESCVWMHGVIDVLRRGARIVPLLVMTWWTAWAARWMGRPRRYVVALWLCWGIVVQSTRCEVTIPDRAAQASDVELLVEIPQPINATLFLEAGLAGLVYAWCERRRWKCLRWEWSKRAIAQPA